MVSLFSYSSLTFNRHRIHYDRKWAQEVEGYRGLVVHGPYTMQLLIDFLSDNCEADGAKFIAFEMQGRAPLFVDEPILLLGRWATDGPQGKTRKAEAWAVAP